MRSETNRGFAEETERGMKSKKNRDPDLVPEDEEICSERSSSSQTKRPCGKRHERATQTFMKKGHWFGKVGRVRTDRKTP